MSLFPEEYSVIINVLEGSNNSIKTRLNWLYNKEAKLAIINNSGLLAAGGIRIKDNRLIFN